MVIDTNNINSSGSARSRNTTPIATSPAKSASASPETLVTNNKNDVVLSPEAQTLSRLQAKINQLPDVNLERVAAIKLAIAEGRFEFNPERIAENMLRQDELLS